MKATCIRFCRALASLTRLVVSLTSKALLEVASPSDLLRNSLRCSAIPEQRFVASSLGELLVVCLSSATDL